MTIGSRIREARKARGISQGALAEKIGMKQPSLSQLESGESHRTSFLGQIAAELRVNALWLETGRGPRDAVLAGTGAPGSLNLQAESAAELQMLLVYRSANEREREALDNLVNELRLRIEARARDQVQLAG